MNLFTLFANNILLMLDNSPPWHNTNKEENMSDIIIPDKNPVFHLNNEKDDSRISKICYALSSEDMVRLMRSVLYYPKAYRLYRTSWDFDFQRFAVCRGSDRRGLDFHFLSAGHQRSHQVLLGVAAVLSDSYGDNRSERQKQLEARNQYRNAARHVHRLRHSSPVRHDKLDRAYRRSG